MTTTATIASEKPTALESKGVILDSFSKIKTRSLTTIDRCDREFSAAATVRAVKNGQELLFCTHHAHMHAPTLVSQGWMIDDQS